MTQASATPTALAGRGYQLRVGDPDQLAVSLVLAPQHSVCSLTRQAASGSPDGEFAQLRRRLRPQSRFAFGSFAHSGLGWVPDCCLPIPPTTDVSVAAQVDRLRDLPGQVLLDELDGSPCMRPTAAWVPAGDRPGRWLRSWADTCLDAWAVLEPRWRRAGPLLDREIRRIGTAVVRDGLDVLLNSLHPRISYADGVIAFAVSADTCSELNGRQLVLVPMLTGQLLVSYELPGVAYLSYPLRRPWSSCSSSGTGLAADDSLTLILGPARAAALRALRRPLTVSQLAAAIGCAPTTATYHAQQLAAAGLAVRERRGAAVQISRTQRGAELVELMADLPGATPCCRALPARPQGRR